MARDYLQDAFQEAFRLATEGVRSGDGGPFGAVVVNAGRIVGRGHNRVVVRRDPTAHAEIEAIRDACARLGTFRLEGCEIYASCEPCPMCHAAIVWAGIGKIVYGATREEAAAAGFADVRVREELEARLPSRRIPLQRALHSEAQEPFRAWAAKADRVQY